MKFNTKALTFYGSILTCVLMWVLFYYLVVWLTS